MAKRQPKEIAPRLVSGLCRLNVHVNLPPNIKAGLFSIARHHNIAVAYMVEKAIYDYFGLEHPEFVQRKQQRQTARVTQFRRAATHRRRA